MTCSPARLAANRANAAKSTGPRTEEGKARSRANAMTHGLAAEVVRTAEEERAAEEAGAGSLAGWLRGEVAVLTMRIDRAQKVEERERERAALRAERCWEDDRRREADRIGRGLARCPDRVVGRLRGTVQGCDWLIERWGWLRDAATREGGWSEEQQAMASDLRGIPEAFRGDGPGVGGQAAMAEGEIRALNAVREALKESDAFERESTRKGLDDGATPELRRAIRYEAALHRRLRWCRDQLRAEAAPVAPPPKAPAPPPVEPARPAAVVEARPAMPRAEDYLDELKQILADRFPTMLDPVPCSTLAVAIAPTAHRRN